MLVSLESQMKKKICFEYVVLENTRAFFSFEQTLLSYFALNCVGMVQQVLD